MSLYLYFIFAVIQPHRFDAVQAALRGMRVEGMTAADVRGYGRQKGHEEAYRGAEYTISFVPKLKIEVAVMDGWANPFVAAIRNGARTGENGDRKIFFVELKSVMRVCTGGTDADAI